MKKNIKAVLLLFIICFTLGSVAMASNIGVILDGKSMQFDVPPVSEGGRTLVPMRAIFEALGAEVDWNNST